MFTSIPTSRVTWSSLDVEGERFLESGYVYAPYVPLQVTPTIFGIEDFVPRKGVMTRYAKKMVRPDMYGLVIVRGLLGEAGATS